MPTARARGAEPHPFLPKPLTVAVSLEPGAWGVLHPDPMT